MSYTEDTEETESGFSPSAKDPSEGETLDQEKTGESLQASPAAKTPSVTRVAMATISASAGSFRRPEDTVFASTPENRAEEENRLLKKTLARSREDCNELITRQNELIETLTERVDYTLENVQKTIYKRFTEFTATSNDNFDALKETLMSFESDLKKESADSVAKLTETTDAAIAALSAQVGEESILYRKILETCLTELKETKAELAKAMREEPLTKREAADLLKKSIEKTAEDLTEYYKDKLADSVSALNDAIKKTKKRVDNIGRSEKRGKRLSRAMLILNPIVLVLVCVISIIGLFV